MTDSDSRPAGEAAIHRSGEPRHDVTQTFGHDSDLSFVPFGVELTDVEQSVIAALPSGSALLLVRSGALAGARYLLDTDVTTVGRHPEADIFFDSALLTVVAPAP